MGVLFIATLFIFYTKKSAHVTSITKTPLIKKELVNLSSNQAGIYWESKDKEEGWIQFGEKGEDVSTNAYDDRDLSPNLQKYTHHYVALKNLKEDKNYYFRIMNKRGAYVDKDMNIFHFKTPKKETQRYSGKPAYGKVLMANGKPRENILVLLTIEGKIPLLALSKSTGEWLLPLNSIIEKTTGKTVYDISSNTRTNIEFIEERGSSSHVVTFLANINPMAQTIILGRNYSLLAQQQGQGDVLSVSTGKKIESKSTVAIVYPRENAIIPALRPLIKGQGLPGSDVTAFINSSPQFTFRTKVDKVGEWRILPTDPISPGSYVLTITSKDETGAKITIKRNFIIAKSGEQVLGLATGEPTLPPPTTTPTRSISATPVPTLIVFNPTPTLHPTLFQPTSQPQYPITTPTNTPPRTGGSLTGLLFASLILLFVGGGLMLVF